MKFIFKESTAAKREFARMRNAGANFKQAVRGAGLQIGQDVVRSVQVGIESGPKTGKRYRLKKNGRIVDHQASAAGEYPAIITGKFKNSFSYKMRGHTQIEVGSNDPKSVFLELGTNKMQPREPLKQSVKATEKNAFNYLKRMATLGLTR